MKRINFLLAGLVFCVNSYAASSAMPLLSANIDIRDKASLQRGAAFYMNYCSGCHSLRYMRYNQMGKDLAITDFTGTVDEDLLYNNLIFTEAKVHDPIEISMPPEDARQWFGVPPPDLSLITREHGVDWVYTFLKSFYADDTRPFGANNLLVSGVAMPNVLEPLSGRIIAPDSNNRKPASLLLVSKGEMSSQQFDRALLDLVSFLSYVGEPVQLVRYRIGVGVLLFLALFLMVAWPLKKLYWNKLKR
ncbi:MAG: cytochrome c1 [Legionellaceae bacterium]|nr:cytochrome c1 [Legionellaceae bacterium]